MFQLILIWKTTKSRKFFFTLIEIFAALALLLLAGGLVGWRMHEAVAKKKFFSDLERLQERFEVSKKIAIAMQTDWKGKMKRVGEHWVFDVRCFDQMQVKGFAPLNLHSFTLFYEGKKVDELEFDFFSSGQVSPNGILRFCQKDLSFEWKINPNSRAELGPIHPDENS